MLKAVVLGEESARLDALVSKLEKSPGSELLVEHLQTAHADLHGGMPEEAAHNLMLAGKQSHRLADKDLGREVRDSVAVLIDKLHSHASSPRLARVSRPEQAATPAPTAAGLDQFFHGTDVTLGVFYPRKHVVAVFRSFDQARRGLDHLQTAGLGAGRAIAVPGAEVVAFLERLQANQTLWATLVAEFSRVLDTEVSLVDSYNWWAHRGAGFLVVYSPAQEDAEAICELLKPDLPLAMHWFTAGYIRHLI